MPARLLEVKRDQLAHTRIFDSDVPQPADGEIVVAIDAFALTANNITYGVVGDKIGYWRFFPREDEWGIIPVWGFADVVASAHDEIAVGERLYGYFPMGTHLVMQPGRVSAMRLFDLAAHRSELPPVYNSYARCNHEPHYQADLDDARMVLFPLYATSFCLYDYLLANDYFGADQVLIPSASSKTAIGLAMALHRNAPERHVVGLTSPGNVDQVTALGLYDQVVAYPALDDIDSARASVIVDMSGNGTLLADLHIRLGEQMRFTSNVGLTHYQDNRMADGFIHDRSQMFFAPAHIETRTREWGPGEFDKRAYAFWLEAARASSDWLSYRHLDGMDLVQAAYREVLAGEVRPDVGLVLRPNGN